MASKHSSSSQVYKFEPINVGRWLIWGLFALVLISAPLVFTSSLGQMILTQMGIVIIICLSYNILLGQGGMLSFGHAVYSGLGSFVAMHTLNAITAGSFLLPVSLVPLVGGLAGLFFAALFGSVTVKTAGTPFAEAGVSGNRIAGSSPFGITFGPQIQLYYLSAFYLFICTALMFAFTRTPLGRILNAVRDNPERVEFVGYDTERVRYIAFMVAGFFAGIGGAIAALHFEIVTSENVSGARSTVYLLWTFLGGATFFFGAIFGGVMAVLAFVMFSELTKAWLLYLGLLFLFMVMYAPGGFAGLIMMNLRVASFGFLRKLWVSYLALGVTAMVALLGASVMIEMIYHLQFDGALGDELKFLSMTFNAKNFDIWFGSGFLMLTGLGLFELCRKQFLQEWGEIQEDIENEIKRRQALS